MTSLKADFDELRERIRQGRDLGHTGFEPVYYLVFSPEQIVEVKRQTSAWLSRLKQDGWQVSEFSIAQALEDIFNADPRRPIWAGADARAPLSWTRVTESLSNAVAGPTGLLPVFEAQLKALESLPNALLVVTDLEALHPYIRIGTVESQLIGRFQVPTIFLYPGTRTGRTGLRFLGIYPSDGNYRSVHVGG